MIYDITKFIAVDAGNSSVKVGLFSGLRILSKKVFRYDEFELSQFAGEGIKEAIVASVVPSKNPIIESELKKIGVELIRFIDHKTNLGIKVEYDPPESIGADRLALLCGAYHLYTSIIDKAGLVISCGSAITINLIDKDGFFKGGAIIPGIRLMMESLSKLELLKPYQLDSLTPTFAHSTKDSVVSGVSAAITGAIEKFISLAPDAIVILTGSYADIVADASDTPFVVDHDLAIRGLAFAHLLNRNR